MSSRQDDTSSLWSRCYSCGHRLAHAASHCPQCGEQFDARRSDDDLVQWPDCCGCPRCVEARSASSPPVAEAPSIPAGSFLATSTSSAVTLPSAQRLPETRVQSRARLGRVLAELDREGRGTFLDLCELVVLYAERVNGMMKWQGPRVVVHIQHPQRVKKSRAASGTKK